MNADKMATAGSAMFSGGCAFILLTWILIPLVVLGVLFTLSAFGALD